MLCACDCPGHGLGRKSAKKKAPQSGACWAASRDAAKAEGAEILAKIKRAHAALEKIQAE